MIFYFSGTGNSAYVAETLGSILNEDVVCISDIKDRDITFKGETLGLVFPVYSWGVAPDMLDFVDSLPHSFIHEVNDGGGRIWIVMTCGDEVALAPEMIQRSLMSRCFIAESIWSVTMPNNYVLLPGFDVDPHDLERKKLDEARTRINEIAEGIISRQRVVDVVRGSMPRLKTKLIYPLFRKWGIFPVKWRSSIECIGCGICAANCCRRNITMKKGRPVWGGDCCSCLACYHRCPRHAVEYGGATKRKGQYFFPGKIKRKAL